MSRRYCRYCGRVAYRCRCADEGSALHQFFARNPQGVPHLPALRDQPYKRGVPPQVKRRERTTLRRHYRAWYAALVAQSGEICVNCGEDDPTVLVIDHIVSIAHGGCSALDNLQLLCRVCNRLKGKLCIRCIDHND